MAESKKKKVWLRLVLDTLFAPLTDVLNSPASRAKFPSHEHMDFHAYVQWIHESSSETAVKLVSVARGVVKEYTTFDVCTGPSEADVLNFLHCRKVRDAFYLTRALFLVSEQVPIVRPYLMMFFKPGGVDLCNLQRTTYFRYISLNRQEGLAPAGKTAVPQAVSHEVPLFLHLICFCLQREPDSPNIQNKVQQQRCLDRIAYATHVVVSAWDALSKVLGHPSSAWIYEYLRFDPSTLQFVARQAEVATAGPSQPSLKGDAMRFCATLVIESLEKLLLDPGLRKWKQRDAGTQFKEFFPVNGELPPIFREIPYIYARVLGIRSPGQTTASPAVASPSTLRPDTAGSTGDTGIEKANRNANDAVGADDAGSGNAEPVGIKRARVKTESVHESEDSSRLSDRRVRQRVESMHVPGSVGPAHESRSEEDPGTESSNSLEKAPGSAIQLEAVLRDAPDGFVRGTAMPLHVTAAVASLNQSASVFSNFRDVCTSEWSEGATKALHSADRIALQMADATAAKVIIERKPGDGGDHRPYRTVACGRFVKGQVVCDVFGTMLYQAAESLPEAWVDGFSGKDVRKEDVIGSLVRVGTCAGPVQGSVVPVLLSPARFSVAAHIRVVGGLDRHNAVFEVGSSTISADNVEKAGFVCVRASRNISRGEEVVISMEATTVLE